MQTLIHADIFFFVTTIAVVIFMVISIIASYYFISMLKNLRDISAKLKHGVDMVEEGIEESSLFRFFFGSKKKHHK